ncbi:MAG: preprotein translocase subunit SecE [Candidatus Woesebacteria bacterium]
MKNLIKYFKEVLSEIKKVTWPNKKQTINKTFLVILVSLIVAGYIGTLDFVFHTIMKSLISR